MYMISPRFCHRFVGYLEEQAVHTYTVLLKCIDDGKLPQFALMKAPKQAIEYYDMPPDATFRDMILAIRADEACHRETNHHFADINPRDNVTSHEVELKEDGKYTYTRAIEEKKDD